MIDFKTAKEWSGNNPGAATALSMIAQAPNEIRDSIFNKLEEAKSIRGTNIWVLYSDICGKDVQKVYDVCRLVPTPVLEDACNRQDYSGKAIVNNYIKF